MHRASSEPITGRPPVRIALFVAMTLAAGCGGDSAMETTQVGDTVMVANRAPLVADTLLPIEVARYGRQDGAPEYLFSDVFAFAVGPRGDVYVHDRGEGIRRFSVDGAYAGHVARAGEGPSEVDYVLAMDVAPDGRVAAYDLGNARISIFSADGVQHFPRPDGMPRYRAGGITFHDDGSLWVGVTPPFPEEGGIRHPRAAFIRLGADGASDTVATPGRLEDDCSTLSVRQYQSGFWEDRREPFVPKAKWSLGRDGSLVVGCPRRYAFDVVSGDEVLRVSRPWIPVELTEGEADFWARFGRAGRLPDRRPAYARLIVPGDGRIWVWPTQSNVLEELPAEAAARFGVSHRWTIASRGGFDVFDSDGRWRAIVRLPDAARYSGYPTEPDVVIKGDTLWAVARDDLDVEYVVRYEVAGLSGDN